MSDNHVVVGIGGRSLGVNELRQEEDRLKAAGMLRNGAPQGLRLGVGAGWQSAAKPAASSDILTRSEGPSGYP